MHIPRLYVSSSLLENTEILLSEEQGHHLSVVLRMKEGEDVLIFNEVAGEYYGTLVQKKKKQFAIEVRGFHRPAIELAEVHLYFSPLKPERMSFLIEKATELGVTHFHPYLSKHSQNQQHQEKKWKTYALLATQQCERFSLPVFFPITQLKDVVQKEMAIKETFFVALEREERTSFLKSLLSAVNKKQQPLSFLVGPEGGFSDQEVCEILKSGCQTVSLGQTILRAETAALMGLSLFRFLDGLEA